ncbi:MAG: hypothetical protein B7Y39_05445 [Bdellovibrio sp. 28-41-41]|nr:MAG: hypothetical protein B7Y39_05445 [Bdellovibrio sp. 28-41-41]
MSKQDKDGNILEFPSNRMIRQKSMQRTQEKKAVLGLSVLGLFVFTVAANQWISDFNKFGAGSRNVASIQMDNKQAILKEHLLAKEIATQENIVGFKSQEPSLKDEMIFSSLEGKYRVKSDQQRVLAVQSEDDSESRIEIADGELFVKKYISLFNDKAVHFKLSNRSDVSEVYELLDQKGMVIDRLQLDKDSAGKLTQLKVL